MAVALLSPPLPAAHTPTVRHLKLSSVGRITCRSSKRIVATVSRRDLVLLGVSSSAAFMFPSTDSYAVVESGEDVKTALIVDDINAYSFQYPVELPAQKFVFKWVESRKPERYSSAAPLSPDARQRIVYERVDFINNLVLSVSIGPPNSNFLTSSDKNTWGAKNVADSVLSDKSALPISTKQRVTEGSVLDAHSAIVDGEPYWYYEYLVRKSPTAVQESNLFRHNVAATAERDGFLYSLNVSTLSKKWESILSLAIADDKTQLQQVANLEALLDVKKAESQSVVEESVSLHAININREVVIEEMMVEQQHSRSEVDVAGEANKVEGSMAQGLIVAVVVTAME